MQKTTGQVDILKCDCVLGLEFLTCYIYFGHISVATKYSVDSS